MKILYQTKPRKFPKPEDLKNAMQEYLEYIKNENKPIEYFECMYCKERYDKKPDKCNNCSNTDFNHIYSEISSRDLLFPSMYGFAAYAGVHIQTVRDYKEREGYTEIYEWFLSVLQSDLEKILLNPGTRNIGGAKFVAINNYGWKDKVDVEHTGTTPITFVNDIPKTVSSESDE